MWTQINCGYRVNCIRDFATWHNFPVFYLKKIWHFGRRKVKFLLLSVTQCCDYRIKYKSVKRKQLAGYVLIFFSQYSRWLTTQGVKRVEAWIESIKKYINKKKEEKKDEDENSKIKGIKEQDKRSRLEKNIPPLLEVLFSFFGFSFCIHCRLVDFSCFPNRWRGHASVEWTKQPKKNPKKKISTMRDAFGWFARQEKIKTK